MTQGSNTGRRAPLVLGGLVVAVLVGVTVWTRMSPGTPAPTGVAETTPVAGTPDSRAERARASGRVLQRQGMTTVGVPNAERRAEARAEHAKRIAESKARAIATYESETVDAAWAPGKERELGRIAELPGVDAQAGIKPKSFEVDCRRSMCKLDGAFANSSEAQDWTLMYMSSVGSAMPRSIVSRTTNPDGTMNVRIYGKAR